MQFYLRLSTVEKFVEFRNICNIKTWLQQQKFTDHRVHMIFCDMHITNKKTNIIDYLHDYATGMASDLRSTGRGFQSWLGTIA